MSASAASTVLHTDERQLLNHQNIIRIGENLRQQQQQEVEEDKRRAILCTEEVVRREELCKQEQHLNEAREEWKKERQQIFQEAHNSQLRAIAKQTTILEKKLRKEFADNVAKLEDEHRVQIDMTIRKTWEEADEVKETAICDTRQEEQEIAREEARRVADKVYEQKLLAAEKAAKDKVHALEEQRQGMEQLRKEALEEQKRELEANFQARLNEQAQIESAKLDESEERYREQKATSERLERELSEMTEMKDKWEKSYQDLKVEFSNFIDQFPGFKGEFILK